MFNVGVFAVIFDDKKRILFCHRTDHDLWNLPGGALEKGEAPWQGVIREVKEETGLDVAVDRLAGVYYTPNQNQIAFSFICKIIGGEPTVTEESDGFSYFQFKEIPKNFPPRHRERIKHALERPQEIVLEIQRTPSVKELIKQGKL